MKESQHSTARRRVDLSWIMELVWELVQRSLPRYTVAITISVLLHLVFFGGYLGLSALDKPEVLEIREISFIDLTQEPQQDASKTRAAKEEEEPGKKPEPSEEKPPPPPDQNPPVRFARRLDMVRKQAPINLAQHSPIALARQNEAEVIKVSPAKGTQDNDKLLHAPPAINLDESNRLQLPETRTTKAFASYASPGPKINLNNRRTNAVESQEQPGPFQPVTAAHPIEPSTGKKSRTMITGPLASRKILQKVIPAFPRWARRQGVGATISLQFAVMEDGKVKENIVVVRTSGSGEWDQAVIQALKKWTFAPLSGATGRRDQTGIITFQFVID